MPCRTDRSRLCRTAGWGALTVCLSVLGWLSTYLSHAPRPQPSVERGAGSGERSTPGTLHASRNSAPQNPRRSAVRAPRHRRALAPAVGYRKVIISGIPLHVVQADLKREAVRIAVAAAGNGIGYRDSWSAIVDRTRPAAAITGTYFCPRSALPVGSIVTVGQRVHTGGVGTALVFTPGKGARIVTCRPGIRYNWQDAQTVLRAGPRLLTRGRRTLYPYAEGFRDPAIFARKRRTAVALTRHGKLLLVAVEKPVLLRTFAEALRRLGAVDAMGLDGGGSTALCCHGKTWVKTSRPLTNLLVLYDSEARYQRYASLLVPQGPSVARAPTSGRAG